MTIQTQNIPEELKTLNQWVLWKKEERNDKTTKIPYQVNGSKASANDPQTWGSIDDIEEAFLFEDGYDGIGFVFTEADHFVGVDLDTYKLPSPSVADDIINKLDSYTEYSPSGRGSHVILKGAIPENMKCKSEDFHGSAIEVYNKGRYFTFTGNIYGSPKPINDRQNELESALAGLIEKSKEPPNKPQVNELPASKSDNDIINWISNRANKGDDKCSYWLRLHNGGFQGEDMSADDMAYCNCLAYLHATQGQIDALYRQSAIYRTKWDEKRGDSTYGQNTIAKALKDTKRASDSVVNKFNELPPAIEKSPLAFMRSKSGTGKSYDLEAMMSEQKFTMKGLAIQGQWTVFYAAPNSGKTLLSIWLIDEAIDSGELDPDKVFYINADDTLRGAKEKIEIAERTGFHMLADGVAGWEHKHLKGLMASLIKEDEAKGVVIIMDTLKKFTDLMDKRESSEFGKLARRFVQAGGTIIALAHVNKRKGDDGKSIHSGTSDVKDDSDCVYILDVIEGSGIGSTTMVEFTNEKARGDISKKVCFSYDSSSRGYEALFDSVTRVNEEAISIRKEEIETQKQREDDGSIIFEIKRLIELGIANKGQIAKTIFQETEHSRRKVFSVMKRWSFPNKLAAWRETRLENNEVILELLD